MDLQLKGKTALVTGASQGIGRAIAKGLAAEGVKNLHRRAPARIARAGRQGNRRRGRAAAAHRAGRHHGGRRAAETRAGSAARALGEIGILINCAGGSRPLPIDAPEEKWTEAMTLNFTRVRQLSHAVFPDMIKHQWGRIINITGKSEPEGLNAAFSAKAGIHAWAKGLSREIGKHGITINCIPPGRIMSEQIRRNYPEEYRKEHSAREIPVGRYGEPEELACLAVFLASPLACLYHGHRHAGRRRVAPLFVLTRRSRGRRPGDTRCRNRRRLRRHGGGGNARRAARAGNGIRGRKAARRPRAPRRAPRHRARQRAAHPDRRIYRNPAPHTARQSSSCRCAVAAARSSGTCMTSFTLPRCACRRRSMF